MPADLRSACYRAVLLDAEESTFLDFLEMYRGAELHEEKDRISRALGAIKDVKLLEKVLAFAMSVSVSDMIMQKYPKRPRRLRIFDWQTVQSVD